MVVLQVGFFECFGTRGVIKLLILIYETLKFMPDQIHAAVKIIIRDRTSHNGKVYKGTSTIKNYGGNE